MAYLTKGELLNYLQIETNAYIDAGFSTWLAAVQAYIERYTGKKFETTAGETRYFDGNGKRELLLSFEDDLISITTFQTLDLSGNLEFTLTEGAANDFLLYPLNTTPKWEIKLTVNSQIGAFAKGKKNIKITGTWGNNTTVPGDIKMATMMLLSDIVGDTESKGVSSIRLGDYQISYESAGADAFAGNAGAMAILDNYKEYDV